MAAATLDSALTMMDSIRNNNSCGGGSRLRVDFEDI
jgi:hypothetical protein